MKTFALIATAALLIVLLAACDRRDLERPPLRRAGPPDIVVEN